jgi:hypothetical protein
MNDQASGETVDAVETSNIGRARKLCSILLLEQDETFLLCVVRQEWGVVIESLYSRRVVRRSLGNTNNNDNDDPTAYGEV